MGSPRRILVLAVVSAAALLALATPALADQAFHTLKAPLSAVGNAPLHSGWVSDSHANGPIIGSQWVKTSGRFKVEARVTEHHDDKKVPIAAKLKPYS